MRLPIQNPYVRACRTLGFKGLLAHVIPFGHIRFLNLPAAGGIVFGVRLYLRGLCISVADGTSIVSGVAGRYAKALFDLAREKNQLDQVNSDLNGFQSLLDESDDLQILVESPLYSTDEQGKAMSVILGQAGLSSITENFLKVIAANRRLFAVSDIIKGYKALLSNHRGEISAEAVSATALSDAQRSRLTSQLKEIAGQDIELNTKVDPSILGGLIVRLGSRQIDGSLRTKLNGMKTLMKEVS